jgi:exopolysaccharide biosynthesis polyprenyl glycosylphosphotransferase
VTVGPEEQVALGEPRRRSLRRLSIALPFQGADARGLEERAPSHSVARRESISRRLLAVADLVGAAFALFLAVEAFGDDSLKASGLLALPLVVFISKIQGLYDRDGLLINKTTLDEAPKLFQLATLYTLVVLLAQSSLINGALGTRQGLGLWVVLFGTSVAGRWFVRQVARKVTGTERVLVLGGRDEAERLDHKLRENPTVNATIIGRVALDERQWGPEVLGGMSDLEKLVRLHQIHRVIVAPGSSSYDQTLDGVRAAKAVGASVSVLPRLLEVVGSSSEFDQLYGVSILGVRRFGLSTSSQFIKRSMDQAGAALGLLVLAIPFAVVSLLIRATSAGPAFFRQQRIGQDGKPFELLKFRTMVEGADELRDDLADKNEAPDGLFKIADDPRVTPVGRFLRRTSLDELPQLINVFKGEMSLVGPRPLIPEEDVRIEGRHRRRLHLKPGMTGQWQIFGSSKIPLREMVTIDYLYVANWSLWGDIKILCRTVPYMLARRGL